MNKKERRTIKYDYYPLKGFVYGNRLLKNINGLSKFLGIAAPSTNSKLENISMFSQDEIYRIMTEFKLTPQQVVDFFFTVENEEKE